MKTSIEIAESLFRRVKQLSRARNTSVRALVEEGLRAVLDLEEKKRQIKPKMLTFEGDGLTDEFRSKGYTWDSVRDEVYRGHGS